MLRPILVSLAACGAFLGIFLLTGNIWAATNVAGLIALAYLSVLITEWISSPSTALRRILLAAFCAAFLVSTAAHWIIWWSMTDWQARVLHESRKAIGHGVFLARLQDRGLKTLAAYYAQPRSSHETLHEVFAKSNPLLDPSRSLLDTLEDGMKVYLAAATDSEVVMLGLDGFTQGEDPHFKSFDGRTGIVQDRVRVTPESISYVIDN